MTPPLEYCGDTPLSMTASLLGIFAYASALLAGLLVFFASLRNSTSEIRHRLEDFDSSLSQFDALTERLRNYEAEGRDMEYLNELVRRTARQIQNTIRTLQDMGLMTGSFTESRERGRVEYGRITKWTVGGRFVFRRDEVADKLKRTQTMLAETQLGVMQFEQDILRSYLRRINEDQLTRSNALYKMVTELKSPRDQWTPDSAELWTSHLTRDTLPQAVQHTVLGKPNQDPLGRLLRMHTDSNVLVQSEEKDMADYSSDDSTSKLDCMAASMKGTHARWIPQ